MNNMANKETAGLVLRPPADAAEWRAIHALRRRALFDDSPDYDENHPDDRDPDHRLLALFIDGRLLGTVRVDLSHPAWAAFRLVAIDPQRRGHGYGTEMLKLAENFIKEKGWRQVRLHAKPEAAGFYKRCGYHAVTWEEAARMPECVDMGKHL